MTGPVRHGPPHEGAFDETLALLSDGYDFISTRCQRLGSNVFRTRLMLRPAVCVRGPDAAAAFYQPQRFTRRGALPPTTVSLLQDKGSVQTLDGAEHRWRKRMFMSLMSPPAIARLADLMEEQWRARIDVWAGRDRVVLLEEAREILCRAVCEWAGVPLDRSEAAARTREFAAMIDGAGAVGPRNWRGQLLRRRTERWARQLVDAVRGGRLAPPEGSPLHVIAWHRDLTGVLLAPAVAAVELINVLRPTVAVARFVVFAALALHAHEGARQRVRSDPGYLEPFVQEVRRYYPYFPLIAGRALRRFEWQGYRFAKGTWMLLDLYGTDHDGRVWAEPDQFRPERFRDWDGNAFTFIPQGGGDFESNHRCAGEWITIELMKRAVTLLTTAMDYDVPAQDLRVDRSRMPATPHSGFVISDVRPRGGA